MNLIRYEVIIYWSEESGRFLALVPEIAGCSAVGRTYQEMVANIERAIGNLIEAAVTQEWPVPEPGERLICA